MKVFCILLIICIGFYLSCADIVAQNIPMQASKQLFLRGEIESVEIRDIDRSSSLIEVKLKMELVNISSKPIILLRRDPNEFIGSALAKSPNDFKTGNILASNYGGPSNSIDPEWAALRAKLDTPNPPPDETRILMPDELWQFQISARVGVPTKSGRKDKIEFIGTESLQVIQQLSPIWLRVTIHEIWPFNVEKVGPDRDTLKLGHKLQKRWKAVGLLWLEDIYSEPIILDLKTATYKTASH
jgi:hypothetical protein